jgi:hypothetical protein
MTDETALIDDAVYTDPGHNIFYYNTGCDGN